MLNAVQPNICFIGSSNLALAALIGGLVLKRFQKKKILIEEKKINDTNALKQKENGLKKLKLLFCY